MSSHTTKFPSVLLRRDTVAASWVEPNRRNVCDWFKDMQSSQSFCSPYTWMGNDAGRPLSSADTVLWRQPLNMSLSYSITGQIVHFRLHPSCFWAGCDMGLLNVVKWSQTLIVSTSPVCLSPSPLPVCVITWGRQVWWRRSRAESDSCT